jgi:hypothetical protein
MRMFYWLSLQWENHERSWSRHKDYFDKSSALQSSVQEVKKYHNQVLLDLFEDDTSRFCCSKAQFTDLDYFLAHNKSPTMTLFMIRLWAMVN